MGLSVSKRVEDAIESSPDFSAACQAVYDHCLAETNHAFPGVRPYQLADAAASLHARLSPSVPLVHRWVSEPPTQGQVDAALRRVDPTADSLSTAEFRAFAAELFKDAVLDGAGKLLIERVPIGVAGIAGVGAVTRSGVGLVGKLMGVYALGIVAATYLSLG